MKLHLTIAYFGQRYHGWQRQPGRPTVQEAVEQAAARVFDEPVTVIGASRTDAGVHAEGQSAHAVVTNERPIDRVAMALNARLPTDIDIRSARVVPDEFDARKSACWKHYRYRVHNATSRPVADWGRVYHYWRTMDDARLVGAAARFIGTHDFAAFAHASSQPRATTVRTIYRLDVTRTGDSLVFDICGDGFLYKQIRNTVGALLDVGRGHRPVEWIDEMIAGGKVMRQQHGPPAAPAQGLTLMQVNYAPFPQAGD